MPSLSAIGNSGMQAAMLRLDASANNVANMNTPDYRRLSVSQEAAPDNGGVQATVQRASQPGVALEQEAVEQMSATYSFAASVQLLRTQERMMGSLLDTRA